MKTKTWATDGGRTIVLVCDKGDDPVAQLSEFARDQSIRGASFTAIGAFRSVTLGYFDREARDYRRNDIAEQVEVVSLVGDIALKAGEPSVHAHAVVARADATTFGGHLLAAEVWPTLEIVLTETPAPMQKRVDPETGLALIDLDDG